MKRTYWFLHHLWMETRAEVLFAAAVGIIIFAFTYFVVIPQAGPAIEQTGLMADEHPIPEELADHAARGDMERGRSVGATPNTSVPRYPEATFYASPNWSGRGTCGIQGIVIHVTGPGSMAGMASWFKNPSSQVSAHFGIGKNGEVHQYVEVGDSAWHAGILNRPDMSNPLVASWVSQGVNPNRCTIGIELLLAGPAEPLIEYPDMQAALNRLLLWLQVNTGVPLERAYVIGHYQIDSISRSTDPNCCVNIDNVLRGIGGVDTYCCDQSYGGRYNVTKDRWEWKPDDTWYFSTETPVWTCAVGCP